MARVNNTVILIGNISSDIDYKKVSDTPLASFTIAVSRPKGKTGQEYTDFIRCSAWSHNADFIHQYFTKGKKVAIMGELNIDTKKTEDGQTRSYTSVRVDSVSFAEPAPATKKSDFNSSQSKPSVRQKPAIAVVDDDSEDLPWS